MSVFSHIRYVFLFAGEMAPKYKSLLLNTFLVGSKDDDHLVRASSLSNLGEVCSVLGYKLGTVVSEVSICIFGLLIIGERPNLYITQQNLYWKHFHC